MQRPFPVAGLFGTAISVVTMLIGNAAVLAQEPSIQRIVITDGQPGQNAVLTVDGQNLTGIRSLWTDIGEFAPQPPAEPPNDKLAVFTGTVPGETVPGVYSARVVTQQGVSEAASLIFDSLPSADVSASAEDAQSPAAVTIPCCINGSMNPLKSKYLALELAAAEPVHIEAFARRLNSELDPVLRLTNEQGAEVAFCDDVDGLEGDARLRFTPAAAGRYVLELRDVRYTGSVRHFFHLRVGGSPLIHPSPYPAPSEAQPSVHEAEPNDSKETATPVDAAAHFVEGRFQSTGDADWYQLTGTANETLCVTAHTRDIGSPADAVLRLWNADGSMLAEIDDVGPADAQLSATLPADGNYFVTVNELTRNGGTNWNYVLELNQGTPRLEVSASVDRVTVPHAGSASLTLNVKRIGLTGPVRIVAEGLPESLTAPDLYLAANQDSVPLTITSTAAADAERAFFHGPLNLTAIAQDSSATATAKLVLAPPDGAPYRSPLHAPELFVATRPAAAVSLKSDPDTVTLAPGGSTTVNLLASRTGDWKEPVTIAATVPNQLPGGITISAATIEADSATITITADASAAAGMYSLFLQGTSKKDNTTITEPVPPILIHVKNP
ncbi:MAG: hypothetical protein R3C19_20985 [Planctomycetaceae bacterium]